MHVVIAGGGSAGHIEPALNTADALRRADPDVGITMVGSERGLDLKLVPPRGYDLKLIPGVPMPRKPGLPLLTFPGRLFGAVRQAKRILADSDAAVVVGFGSYVALPTYLAARWRKTPIVVHEANATPGLGNRVGAKFTSFVATGSSAVKMPGTTLGMPLRPAIVGLDRAALRAEARKTFALDADRPTLLVTGGSQGAQRLNLTMKAFAPLLRAAGVQVLHSYGGKNEFAVEPGAEGEAPYVAVPYIDRMDLAMAAADMAVSRAGMMTVAEFTAVGLPAAYVPLPIGNGEQRLNAAPVVEAGGGFLVDDAEVSAEWLADNVLPVLTDPERLAAMSAATYAFGIRDGGERLVEMIYQAAGVSRPSQA
jgi:UDP-N-acetylglucosamine--N-acetylmuramyl-(pentapeptide) pyrophosphoryl-undecaprenol N-acetylglucosamine transferase